MCLQKMLKNKTCRDAGNMFHRREKDNSERPVTQSCFGQWHETREFARWLQSATPWHQEPCGINSSYKYGGAVPCSDLTLWCSAWSLPGVKQAASIIPSVRISRRSCKHYRVAQLISSSLEERTMHNTSQCRVEVMTWQWPACSRLHDGHYFLTKSFSIQSAVQGGAPVDSGCQVNCCAELLKDIWHAEYSLHKIYFSVNPFIQHVTRLWVFCNAWS